MCSVCDSDTTITRGGSTFFGKSHFQGSRVQAVDDSYYVIPGPTVADLAAAALIADNIPNDQSTTATVVVGGDRVVSTLNTPEDQDWFRVELEAGVTYEIAQYGMRGGPSGVPLRDPLVELYDSNGNLLRMDDSGGAHSQYADNALIIFTPEVSGTYYINARAWDTSDVVGLGIDLNPLTTKGDYVGDYEVFVRVSSKEPDYYDIRYETVDDPNTERNEIGMPTLDSSPLHSLDWQTRFDGSSRNPDGEEGPRPTGNEVESKIGGKNVIYYYFAQEGEIFVDNAADPLNLTTTMVAKGMSAWEKNAVELALDRYEQVADIVYVETQDRWAADIVVVTYDGTPGPYTPSVLGRMSPPDTASEGQTEFNAGDGRWNQHDLAPGGFFFGTLIHEFGHGHGMAHPHDSGGGRASVMRGIEPDGVANYTLGDFDLNQSVYTMMSYMDGWQTSPYGMTSSTAGYGFIGSLMAFDIAVIQDKYGVNEEWATGDDTYTLRDDNSKAEFDEQGNLVKEATGYKSIWDAGGIDEIVYEGARDTNIDLRPATLKYEYGGGGWMSFAWGIHGGFTVANGVTIENASTGSGNDILIGNAANNRLEGNDGNDSFNLTAGGDDNALGGNGNDMFDFGSKFTDADAVDGGAGTDEVRLAGEYSSGIRLNETRLKNVEIISLASAEPGSYFSYNITMNDSSVAAGATLTVDGSALRYGETMMFYGTNEKDGRFVISGGSSNDWLFGGAGNDTIAGGAGADYIRGGRGADALTGGAGDDLFVYRALAEVTGDRVNGGTGNDQIQLFGEMSGGVNFTANSMTAVEAITLTSGAPGSYFSYNLTMHDGNVAAGATLTVDGSQLKWGESLMFYGGAEADGSFVIRGGNGTDWLNGGAGKDRLQGGLSSDWLQGNGGADTYAYASAAESTGTGRDLIVGFDWREDRIDLAQTVAGWDGTLSGSLSNATFASGLAAAINATLDANSALLFQATGGDLSGRSFLVVDANGNGSYDDGLDYVLELVSPAAPLPGTVEFFI